MTLVERIVSIHERLARANLDHAFGGALALGWCTHQPRGTVNIDLNLFVGVERALQVFTAFSPDIVADEAQRSEIADIGQTRLWWDHTPINIFFNTTPFHHAAAQRTHIEAFAGAELPFLACRDIAVFKAFANRTRDWADLEEMVAAETLDVEAVLGVLTNYVGGTDERIERLRQLAG